MASTFSKKVCDAFNKCVAAKGDCAGLLREIRFRTQQAKKTPFTSALMYVLADLLKTNPTSVFIDSEEAKYIITAIDYINSGETDIHVFHEFIRNNADYLSRTRPLIDYTDFNSRIRSILKSGTLFDDDNITAISAQPTSALKGTITVTYATNNMARDRNEDTLKKILEEVIGYTPNFSNIKVQGIRVYADVTWIPTIKTFRVAKNDTIEDFLDIYQALKESGQEFSELEEAEFLDGLCDSISMSCLTQIDSYSLERFINLIAPEKNISISDRTDAKTAKKNIVKNYEVSTTLDSGIIAILNEYLTGMECDQTTTSEKNFLQIRQVGATTMDKELVSVLQNLGLSKLLEMLQA